LLTLSENNHARSGYPTNNRVSQVWQGQPENKWVGYESQNLTHLLFESGMGQANVSQSECGQPEIDLTQPNCPT